MLRLALAFTTVSAAAWPQAHPDKLRALVKEAGAIAAVEILSTDYSATPADGPMYAEARVLKRLRGSLPERIVFGASAWLGPSYRKGEQRVVFLKRLAGGRDYARKADWTAIETGAVELFFDPGSLASLTENRLEEYLHKTAGIRPPRLALEPAGKGPTGVAWVVRLTNAGDRAFCLAPEQISATLVAHGVNYAPPVRWDRSGLVELKPGMDLSGTLRLPATQVNGASEARITIVNRTLRYPCPSWIGAVSAPAKP